MHGMIAMEYIQDAKALGYKMNRVTFQSKAFPIQVLFEAKSKGVYLTTIF
jgi:competence transcription factor ComK